MLLLEGGLFDDGVLHTGPYLYAQVLKGAGRPIPKLPSFLGVYEGNSTMLSGRSLME